MLAARDAKRVNLQLAWLQRMQFGRSSERLTAQADQLDRVLEELEAEVSGTSAEMPKPVGAEGTAAQPQQAGARPLPEHLPRRVVTQAAGMPARSESATCARSRRTPQSCWTWFRPLSVVRHVRRLTPAAAGRPLARHPRPHVGAV